MTGDTSPKQRDVIFGDFQDTPKYKVLLAHPACMSHSLTLTAATRPYGLVLSLRWRRSLKPMVAHSGWDSSTRRSLRWWAARRWSGEFINYWGEREATEPFLEYR